MNGSWLSRVLPVISSFTATPGQYELVLTVKDEITGKTLESHEGFTVVSPTS